ncbi:MAG: Cna B-type domain-containing protein [Firmicutes bacterium]|nr:Cna B-type domain-containing protein [Bacillota bacterium]
MLLLFSMSQTAAFADTSVDTGRATSLTIDHLCCSRVDYTMYKVADISAGKKITWTAGMNEILEKNENPISTVQESQEAWSLVASTLAVYAAEDQSEEGQKLLTPITGAKSGNREVFSGLSTGIYLVVAGEHMNGRERHTITPFLITLPMADENGQYAYDGIVNPKYSSSPGGEDPGQDLVTRSVLKAWNDNGDSDGTRPSSITVQLLRNGVPYGEPVTLSKANNWSYSFGMLDSNYTWQVTEVGITDGYTMTVTLRGTTFLMTNSHSPEDPDTPNNPDDPTEIDDPVTPLGPPPDFPPDDPGITDIPDEDVPLSNLPQTGALWWPVVPLALSGIVLFLLGFVKNRRYEKTHER